METVRLVWRRFERLTAARDAFRRTPCVYVQADRDGRPIRIGKASKGLEARYRGGTGHALDAAMHDSANTVFVAEVPVAVCSIVEALLVFEHREVLHYNIQGKLKAVTAELSLVHEGEPPRWGQAKQPDGEPALIADGALRLADVPAPDAGLDEITRFGHTFDGYAVWGSFEKCADIANARRHETLTDVRTCLFFELRRWRHYGDDPDDTAMQYVRSLIDKIRVMVASRDEA